MKGAHKKVPELKSAQNDNVQGLSSAAIRLAFNNAAWCSHWFYW